MSVERGQRLAGGIVEQQHQALMAGQAIFGRVRRQAHNLDPETAEIRHRAGHQAQHGGGIDAHHGALGRNHPAGGEIAFWQTKR